MHRSVSSEESLLVLSDNQLKSSDAQAFAELGSRQTACTDDTSIAGLILSWASLVSCLVFHAVGVSPLPVMFGLHTARS